MLIQLFVVAVLAIANIRGDSWTGTNRPFTSFPVPTIDCNDKDSSVGSRAFCDNNPAGDHRFTDHPKWIVRCPSALCYLCSPNAVLEYNKLCDMCVGPTDVTNAELCGPTVLAPRDCDNPTVAAGCPDAACTPGVSAILQTINPQSNLVACQCIWGTNTCRDCAPGTKWNTRRDCCA